MAGENQDSGQRISGLRTPLSAPPRGPMDESVHQPPFIPEDDPKGIDPSDLLPKPKVRLGAKVKQWWGSRRSPQNSPTSGEGIVTDIPTASQEQQPQICPYTLEQAAFLDYINAGRLGTFLLDSLAPQVKQGHLGEIRITLLRSLPQAFERIGKVYAGEALYQIERALFPLRISLAQDEGGQLPPDFYTMFQRYEQQLPDAWERAHKSDTDFFREHRMKDITPERKVAIHATKAETLNSLLQGIDRIDPEIWGKHLDESSGRVHILADQIPREIQYLRSLGINVDIQAELYKRKWTGLQKKAEELGPNFSIHSPLPVEN